MGWKSVVWLLETQGLLIVIRGRKIQFPVQNFTKILKFGAKTNIKRTARGSRKSWNKPSKKTKARSMI